MTRAFWLIAAALAYPLGREVIAWLT